MMFLDRLAESRICQARDAGELNNLSGSGQRIPDETEMIGVAPSLRVAYRIMKNAGFIPEELQMRREIAEIDLLLSACQNKTEAVVHRKRLDLLIGRLGEIRGENLILQEAYFRQMPERLGGNCNP